MNAQAREQTVELMRDAFVANDMDSDQAQAVAEHLVDLAIAGDPVANADVALVAKVAGRELSPEDAAATERLMHYWAEGEGAAKIRWGEPDDFYRCVAHLGKHVPPSEVKGLCANLHHRALGVWPGQEDHHGRKCCGPGLVKFDPDEPRGPNGRWVHLRDLLQEPDSGFTVHPHSGDSPSTGYQVGISGHTMKVGGKVPTVDDINAMSERELADHFKRWLRENQDAFANQETGTTRSSTLEAAGMSDNRARRRFFTRPSKPVAQMSDDELDEFALTLARGVKRLAAAKPTTRRADAGPDEG